MHTLLLADDSLTVQRVIELTFADEDIRVVAVSSGEEALAAMAACVPDIVLADVGMPGRNGYEIARHIRATPQLAHTRVLLLAGALEPVDRDRAAAAGCDGVLLKPFDPQQVIARVRALLFESRTGPPVVAPPAAIPSASATEASTKLPSLPEAFAALLAAERAGAVDGVGWPGHAGASEALVEDVVRRVLERLSGTEVRAAVADIVSTTAERLIREEIERIKASIDGPPEP